MDIVTCQYPWACSQAWMVRTELKEGDSKRHLEGKTMQNG
jgi:hypothetical protein